MAATPITSIITRVRRQLVELTPKFWSDAELTDIMIDGMKNLWGSILDLHQEHYFKISYDPILHAATTTDTPNGCKMIDNMPDDVFRVLLVEPANLGVNSPGHQVIFLPRKFNHTDFIVARTQDPQDPTSLPSRQIYYDITGVGAPVQGPAIWTAPLLSADLQLRIVYNPTLEVNDTNPVPGESDNALKAWTIAYAMAKEGEGGTRIPDVGWLAIYGQERQSILVRLTPRQEQEPEVVEDMFQGYGSIW